MSGDASLQCPVCLNMGAFESAAKLRNRLMKITSENIICPVCQEEVIGFEKLVAHLLCHLTLSSGKCEKSSATPKNTKQKSTESNQPSVSNRNKTAANPGQKTAPVKYVKICPKLPVVSSNTGTTTGLIVKKETKSSDNTTCSICNLQFIDGNILKMHMCLIHNVEENTNKEVTGYYCHLCPKNFKMRGSLMVHLRVAHFGFASEMLNSSNNVSNETDNNPSTNLKTVKMMRSDNKQWQCDVCRKYFTTKYFLKKHKRLHTGETPYACTQCNKTFTFQQSYHKHLLYHNDEKPHACNVCGRAFKELSTLHNHQRIHTGEKPFSCETCGKSFRQRVSYLVHKRIHTGVMPYKCTACDKSFRYKVSQRTHKCQAQPPGTVIRQSGDLVEKLKKKHTPCNESTDKPLIKHTPQEYGFSEVSEANVELVLNGAKLSLEDTETEHFDMISHAFTETSEETPQATTSKEVPNHDLEDLIDSIPLIENNIPSPSEILKNLCLTTDIYDNMIL